MNSAASISYIEVTIPVGMTIAEYRRSRARRRPTRWQRLKELAGGQGAAGAAA